MYRFERKRCVKIVLANSGRSMLWSSTMEWMESMRWMCCGITAEEVTYLIISISIFDHSRSRLCSTIPSQGPVLIQTAHQYQVRNQYQISNSMRQTPQISAQSDPISSSIRHPIFRISHPPNHPNIITAGGPYDVHGELVYKFESDSIPSW